MGGSLQRDPAIEKFAAMRDNTSLYFRYTPGNIAKIVVAVVVVPSIMYYYVQEGFVIVKEL